MKKQRILFVEQLDQRYRAMESAIQAGVPPGGWLRGLRHGLGYSLEQLGKRLGVSRQYIGQAEKREAEGTISLNSLRSIAGALDMDLYYVLVPKDGSLKALVARRARQLARELVMRTHQTMKLEGQAVNEERLKAAIDQQVAELCREMPKQLWD